MRKPILHRAAEQGQAIVLIAALMVVLIASVGLAIDGGGLFLLYRDVQNATDAAALTSAFSLCTGDNVEEAGARSATLNGFTDGFNDATVIIQNPPLASSGVDAAYQTDDYVFIRITAQKPSYFIQVVYPGDLGVAAETISKCSGGFDGGWTDGSAIISFSEGCAAGNGNQSGVRARGQGELETKGGGIYVNSDNCQQGGASAGGGGSITAGGYGVCTQGSTIDTNGGGGVATPNGSASTSCPTPQFPADSDPLVAAGVDPLDCTQYTARGSLSSGSNQPGTYSSFDTGNGSNVVLEPGIYCITDNDVRWNGVISNDQFAGGVFLFFSNTSKVQGGNNSDVQLSAITSQSSEWQNLLMWFYTDQWITPTNNTVISIKTRTTSRLTGTVYAPKMHCNLDAQGNAVITGQLACYSVDLTGGSDLCIVYDPATVYGFPPSFGIIE